MTEFRQLYRIYQYMIQFMFVANTYLSTTIYRSKSLNFHKNWKINKNHVQSIQETAHSANIAYAAYRRGNVFSYLKMTINAQNKPEDHWSCIAHLRFEDKLKAVVIEEKKFKHSPWAGADNPLVPKILCQQEGLITMVICCMFERISSTSDFTHIFS